MQVRATAVRPRLSEIVGFAEFNSSSLTSRLLAGTAGSLHKPRIHERSQREARPVATSASPCLAAAPSNLFDRLGAISDQTSAVHRRGSDVSPVPTSLAKPRLHCKATICRRFGVQDRNRPPFICFKGEPKRVVSSMAALSTSLYDSATFAIP